MANAVVLASGRGTNFEALVRGLENTNHVISALIHDRKKALAAEKAVRHSIPAFYISYYKRERDEAEKEIEEIINRTGSGLIILAGFMRLLSPEFTRKYSGKIINIHPSLLPRHKGMDGIKKSYESGDDQLGITIHYVNEELDAGTVIAQYSFKKRPGAKLSEIEEEIHRLEHTYYPEVVRDLLDKQESEHKGGIS
ncbi:MAG: phosphoribosylglycinamide formyltransferase [Spirochaetia bacterium]